jgi:TonB family protein
MSVHAGLAALAFAVVVPVAMEVRQSFQHVSLIAPIPAYKATPLVQHLIAPKIPVHVKTFVPPPVVLPPVQRTQIVEAPEISQPVPEPKVTLPPVPKALVQTGVFQPTTELAKAKATPQIAVGGFGDPQGVKPSETANRQATPLTRVGTFDLPDSAGRNGAGGKTASGGAIRKTGFGSEGEPGRPKLAAEAVRTTAFGDATLTPPPAAKNTAPAGNSASPVEILFKPKPVYTAEARSMRLEGEVSLEVVFQADGTIRLLRVVRGLGHGLDEAAQQAAMRVRFKPATRAGVAVDTHATINISFELT